MRWKSGFARPVALMRCRERLGDCHPGEEEEEAGCKPEFEAKVLLGNLRLWRPRVAIGALFGYITIPLP